MMTMFRSTCSPKFLLLPGAALFAALFSSACGSASTNVIAPTAEKCQISVNAFTATFGPSGGSGSATVDAARECSWSASSQASWINLAAPAQGSGTGTFSFTVGANSAPRARSGSLAVNSQSLTVSQDAAPCRFTVAPAALQVASAGGGQAVSVSASDGACTWNASSQVPWISVGAGGGSGSGSAALTIAVNTGSARSGTVTVASQVVSVAQSAAPKPTPTPTPAPTPVPPTAIHLVGTVSDRKGGCPTLTFSIGGVGVETTADTTFVKTPCNKVKNGLQVTVDGTQQAGQRVVATTVASGGN